MSGIEDDYNISSLFTDDANFNDAVSTLFSDTSAIYPSHSASQLATPSTTSSPLSIPGQTFREKRLKINEIAESIHQQFPRLVFR